jgi:Spy/CpxP family protein refolding chaperone
MRLWILAALLATAAYAQRPIPWWENPVANGLTLSDAQWTQVTQILSESRDRLAAERREAERAERDFEAAVNAEAVDAQRGRAAIDRLVKARSIFTQDFSQMTLRLRAVLTTEQWRSLQTRRVGREGKGPRPEGRGRKGGPAVTSGPGPAR